MKRCCDNPDDPENDYCDINCSIFDYRPLLTTAFIILLVVCLLLVVQDVKEDDYESDDDDETYQFVDPLPRSSNATDSGGPLCQVVSAKVLVPTGTLPFVTDVAAFSKAAESFRSLSGIDWNTECLKRAQVVGAQEGLLPSEGEHGDKWGPRTKPFVILGLVTRTRQEVVCAGVALLDPTLSQIQVLVGSTGQLSTKQIFDWVYKGLDIGPPQLPITTHQKSQSIVPGTIDPSALCKSGTTTLQLAYQKGPRQHEYAIQTRQTLMFYPR